MCSLRWYPVALLLAMVGLLGITPAAVEAQANSCGCYSVCDFGGCSQYYGYNCSCYNDWDCCGNYYYYCHTYCCYSAGCEYFYSSTSAKGGTCSWSGCSSKTLYMDRANTKGTIVNNGQSAAYMQNTGAHLEVQGSASVSNIYIQSSSTTLSIYGSATTVHGSGYSSSTIYVPWGSVSTITGVGSSSSVNVYYTGGTVTTITTVGSNSAVNIYSSASVGTVNSVGSSSTVSVYGSATLSTLSNVVSSTIVVSSGGRVVSSSSTGSTVTVHASSFINTASNTGTMGVSGTITTATNTGTLTVNNGGVITTATASGNVYVNSGGSIATLSITSTSYVSIGGTVTTLSLVGSSASSTITVTGYVGTIVGSTSSHTISFTGGTYETASWTAGMTSLMFRTSSGTTLGCNSFAGGVMSSITMSFSGSSFARSCHFISFASNAPLSGGTVSIYWASTIAPGGSNTYDVLTTGSTFTNVELAVISSTIAVSTRYVVLGAGVATNMQITYTTASVYSFNIGHYFQSNVVGLTMLSQSTTLVTSTAERCVHVNGDASSVDIDVIGNSRWVNAVHHSFVVTGSLSTFNLWLSMSSTITAGYRNFWVGGTISGTAVVTSTGDTVQLMSNAEYNFIAAAASSFTVSVNGSGARMTADLSNLYITAVGASSNVRMYATLQAQILSYSQHNWWCSTSSSMSGTGNILSVNGQSLVSAAGHNMHFGTHASIRAHVHGVVGASSTLTSSGGNNLYIGGNAYYLLLEVTSSNLLAGSAASPTTNNVNVNGQVGTVTTPNYVFLTSAVVSAGSTGFIFNGGGASLTITGTSSAITSGGVGTISMAGAHSSGRISMASTTISVTTAGATAAVVQLNTAGATMSGQHISLVSSPFTYSTIGSPPAMTFASFIQTNNTVMNAASSLHISGSQFTVVSTNTNRMELLDMQGTTRLESSSVWFTRIPYFSGTSCSTAPKGYGPCRALMRGAILLASSLGSVANSIIRVECIEFTTTTLSFIDLQGVTTGSTIRTDSVAIWQTQAIVAFINFQHTSSASNVVYIVQTYVHMPVIVHSQGGAGTSGCAASVSTSQINAQCSFMSVYPMSDGFFEPRLQACVVRPPLPTCSKDYRPSCWVTKSLSHTLSISLTKSFSPSESSLSSATMSLSVFPSGSSTVSETFSISSSDASSSRTARSPSWSVTPTSPSMTISQSISTSRTRSASATISASRTSTRTAASEASLTASMSSTKSSLSCSRTAAIRTATRSVSLSHHVSLLSVSESHTTTVTTVTKQQPLTTSLSVGSVSPSGSVTPTSSTTISSSLTHASPTPTASPSPVLPARLVVFSVALEERGSAAFGPLCWTEQATPVFAVRRGAASLYIAPLTRDSEEYPPQWSATPWVRHTVLLQTLAISGGDPVAAWNVSGADTDHGTALCGGGGRAFCVLIARPPEHEPSLPDMNQRSVVSLQFAFLTGDVIAAEFVAVSAGPPVTAVLASLKQMVQSAVVVDGEAAPGLRFYFLDAHGRDARPPHASVARFVCNSSSAEVLLPPSVASSAAERGSVGFVAPLYDDDSGLQLDAFIAISKEADGSGADTLTVTFYGAVDSFMPDGPSSIQLTAAVRIYRCARRVVVPPSQRQASVIFPPLMATKRHLRLSGTTAVDVSFDIPIHGAFGDSDEVGGSASLLCLFASGNGSVMRVAASRRTPCSVTCRYAFAVENESRSFIAGEVALAQVASAADGITSETVLDVATVVEYAAPNALAVVVRSSSSPLPDSDAPFPCVDAVRCISNVSATFFSPEALQWRGNRSASAVLPCVHLVPFHIPSTPWSVVTVPAVPSMAVTLRNITAFSLDAGLQDATNVSAPTAPLAMDVASITVVDVSSDPGRRTVVVPGAREFALCGIRPPRSPSGRLLDVVFHITLDVVYHDAEDDDSTDRRLVSHLQTVPIQYRPSRACAAVLEDAYGTGIQLAAGGCCSGGNCTACQDNETHVQMLSSANLRLDNSTMVFSSARSLPCTAHSVGRGVLAVDVQSCLSHSSTQRSGFVSTAEELTVYTRTESGSPVIAAAPPISPRQQHGQVVAVHGCATDVFPNTAGCSSSGGDVLTIAGRGFDSLLSLPDEEATTINPSWQHVRLEDVVVEVVFNDGMSASSSPRIAPCAIQNLNVNRSELVCVTSSSYGRDGEIVVRSLATGVTIRSHLHVSKDSGGLAVTPTVSFDRSAKDCPVNPDNREVCSGHGVCNFAEGTCTCYADSLNGFWGGAYCDACAASHNSSIGCSEECPVAPGGLICSGHGFCQAGACSCHADYSGVSCGVTCPVGSNDQICSAHGTCAATTCRCVATIDDGFFDGPACDVCAPSWSGPRCTVPCPLVDGVVCGGHGKCTSGACDCEAGWCGLACRDDASASATCSSCPDLYSYGPECDLVCPGVVHATASACSGHGRCSAGKAGTGRCSCDAGYGLDDCSARCPRSADGALCSARGTCDAATAQCVCSSEAAGPACQFQCPSANGVVCSGHGWCHHGAAANGTCSCFTEFRGPACNVTCSAFPTGGVCSGHGLCVAGVCACASSNQAGHWDGPDCDRCAAEYSGPRCLHQCPRGANGLQCSGHGVCALTVCKCWDDAQHGHWRGTVCDQCVPGFYGAACVYECAGGSCSPCSGNGVCSDGVGGDGSCVCYSNRSAGMFRGDACETCAAGYYGVRCVLSCPAAGGGAELCGGHGTCRDGVDGDGACICAAGFETAVAERPCLACASGFYGPRCLPCPTSDGLTVPCSGHGSCASGTDGDGRCHCDSGFAGVHCGFRCDVDAASGVTCGRGGVCVADWSCLCSDGFAKPQLSAVCTTCVQGRYGSTCEHVCPACNNGTCDAQDGSCRCSSGYWGPQCQHVCPGGAAAPCTGHGVCSVVTGVCDCFSNVSDGFYVGDACQFCDPRFVSPSCNVACPVSPLSGTPCDSRGVCFSGKCTRCAPLMNETTSVRAVCGPACELRNLACFASVGQCPRGFYGEDCRSACPGVTTDGNTTMLCSQRGSCSADTGVCNCTIGYYGEACELSCSVHAVGDAFVPCTGRGTCIGTVCACAYGYYGDSCESECPGGGATPCHGHGTCRGDGRCECDGTAYGQACEHACPGGFQQPCHGNGQCTSTGRCECLRSHEEGFFDGVDCSLCLPPYSGPSCTTVCDSLTGKVVRNVCVCVAGYVGSDCTIPCPGAAGAPCGGHGTCVARNAAPHGAMCVCHDGYYASDCSVPCTPAACRDTRGMLHAQCNATTGTCECRASDALGYYQGPRCDACAEGYWGVQCSLVCPCSGHGSCSQQTGTCLCYRDAKRGFWTSRTCLSCFAGYVGDTCTTKNIELNSVSQQRVYGANAGYPSSGVLIEDFLLADTDEDRPAAAVLLAGSNPVVVLDKTTQRVISLIRLSPPSLVAVFVSRSTNDTAWRVACVDRSSAPYPLLGSLYVPRAPQQVALLHYTTVHVATVEWGPDARGAAALDSTEALHADNSRCVSFALHGSIHIRVLCEDDVVWALVAERSRITALDFVGEVLVASGEALDGSGWSRVAWLLPSRGATGLLPQQLFEANWSTHGAALGSRCGLSTAGGAHTDCDAAARCVGAGDGVWMLCTWRNSKESTVVVAQTSISTGALNYAMPVVSIRGVDRVTAAAEDFTVGCVVFACNGQNAPSALYRYRTETMALVSVFQLPFADTDILIAVGLRIDALLRMMYVSVASPHVVQVLALNLFGIEAVTPDILDLAGGTTVTVTGEGFSTELEYQCVFGSDVDPSIATVVDSRTLICRSPTSSEGGGLCTGANLNVRLVGSGTRITDVTSVPLVRPASAQPMLVVTDRGGDYGSAFQTTLLTVIGTGFIPSPYAACKLRSRTNSSDVYFVTRAVVYVNKTVVICTQPVTRPTNGSALLTYSHDGQVFSETGALYRVVGDFSNFAVAAVGGGGAATSLVVRSARRTRLPPLLVSSVDVFRNPIGSFDATALRRIRCATVEPLWLLVLPEAASWAPDAVIAQNMRNGTAQLAQLVLELPAAGTLRLYCFSPENLLLYDSVFVSVQAGDPHQLNITHEMHSAVSKWRVGVRTASKFSLTVYAYDVAGNVIQLAALLPPTATLTYVSEEPAIDGSSSVDRTARGAVVAVNEVGEYSFYQVSVRATFPRTELQSGVQLLVSAASLKTLSITVQRETCLPVTEYAIAETFDCAECPPYGICTGSAAVRMVPGNWRANAASYTFYPCPLAASCPHESGCHAGYSGPLCATCVAGFGHYGKTCFPCHSDVANGFGVAALLLWYVVEVYVLAIRSMPFTSVDELLAKSKEQGRTSHHNTVPVSILFKILLSHLQVIGAVPWADLPLQSWMNNFITTSRTASTFNPNLSFVSCAIGDSAASRMWSTVALVPVLAGVFTAVSAALSWRARAALEESLADNREDEDEVFKRLRVLGILKIHVTRWLRALERSIAHFIYPSAIEMLRADNPYANRVACRAADVAYTNQHFNTQHRAEILRSHHALLGRDTEEESENTAADLAACDVTTDNGPRQTPSAVMLPSDTAAALPAAAVPSSSLWEQWVNMLLGSIVAVLFLFQPAVVQACVEVLRCMTLDYGPVIGKKEVLTFDPSVDCSSSFYVSRLRPYSYVLLAVFGVCVPVMCPAIVLLARTLTCRGNMDHARAIFQFATGGYRLWFWEGVSLMRRALNVVLISLIPNGVVRTLSIAWVQFVFLGVNAAADPWSSKDFEQAENISFASLAATYSLLGFLYFPDVASSESVRVVISLIILTINALTLLYFAWWAVWAVRETLVLLAQQSPILAALHARLLTKSLVDFRSENQRARDEVVRLHAALRQLHHRSYFFAHLEVDVAADLKQHQMRRISLPGDVVLNSTFASTIAHPLGHTWATAASRAVRRFTRSKSLTELVDVGDVSIHDVGDIGTPKRLALSQIDVDTAALEELCDEVELPIAPAPIVATPSAASRRPVSPGPRQEDCVVEDLEALDSKAASNAASSNQNLDDSASLLKYSSPSASASSALAVSSPLSSEDGFSVAAAFCVDNAMRAALLCANGSVPHVAPAVAFGRVADDMEPAVATLQASTLCDTFDAFQCSDNRSSDRHKKAAHAVAHLGRALVRYHAMSLVIPQELVALSQSANAASAATVSRRLEEAYGALLRAEHELMRAWWAMIAKSS